MVFDAKKIEEVIDKPIMPEGSKDGFQVIIADPCWGSNQHGNRGASKHYKVQTTEWIKSLPVNDLAAENCQLWLWCFNSNIPEALEVMKAWGFRYVSKFTWCKMAMPLGNYLRNADETALLGIKGSAPVRYHSQMSWAVLPRQEHSRKPEEFHVIAQRLHEGPYLELFARRRTPGWFSWGDQIASDVVIPNYPVPEYSDAVKKEIEKIQTEKEA